MGCTLLLPYLKHSKAAGSDLADKPQKFLKRQKAQHRFTFSCIASLSLSSWRSRICTTSGASCAAFAASISARRFSAGKALERLSHDPFGRSWESWSPWTCRCLRKWTSAKHMDKSQQEVCLPPICLTFTSSKASSLQVFIDLLSSGSSWLFSASHDT